MSVACRHHSISRTTSYKYKQRLEGEGLDGLKDVPLIPKSHPMVTPDKGGPRLLDVSLLPLAQSYNHLSVHLKMERLRVAGYIGHL